VPEEIERQYNKYLPGTTLGHMSSRGTQQLGLYSGLPRYFPRLTAAILQSWTTDGINLKILLFYFIFFLLGQKLKPRRHWRKCKCLDKAKRPGRGPPDAVPPAPKTRQIWLSGYPEAGHLNVQNSFMT